jgi:hypothetical protein
MTAPKVVRRLRLVRGPEPVAEPSHKVDRDSLPAVARTSNLAMGKTVAAAMEVTDQGDPNRPKIGEVGLTKAVQDVLLRGGGQPSERAHVAVGLIEAKVRRAYKVGAA